MRSKSFLRVIPIVLPGSKTVTSSSSNKVSTSETSNGGQRILTIKSPKGKFVLPSDVEDKNKCKVNSQGPGDVGSRRGRVRCPHQRRQETRRGRTNVASSGDKGAWHKLKSNFLTVLNPSISNCQIHFSSRDKNSRNKCSTHHHRTKLSSSRHKTARHGKRLSRQAR